MNSIINSAYKCTLNVFIDALIRQDFSGLIVQGKPSDNELQNAFNAILEEYMDLIKSSEIDIKTKSIQKLMVKQAQLAELLFIINIMDSARTPIIEQLEQSILKKYYHGKANYTRIENDIRTLQFDINSLRKAIVGQVKEGEPVSDKTFEQTLSILSTHNNIFLKSNEITVARYAILLKQYEDDNKPKPSNNNNNYKTPKRLRDEPR